MRLYLIRHCATDMNETSIYHGWSDYPLNDEGKIQALKLSMRVSDVPFKAIYSSDLKRCYETGELLALGRGIEIKQDRRLREINLGVLEGRSRSWLQENHPEILKRWLNFPANLKWEGGESLKIVQKRMLSILEESLQKHKGEEIAFISHAFAILSLLCAITNISLNKFRIFRQDIAALNIIDHTTYGWKIVVLNDTSHIQCAPT